MSVESASVVVTGLGAVTPLGKNASLSWRNLLEGRWVVGPVTLFDTEGCHSHVASEVHPLPELEISAKTCSRLPRASRLALPAAHEALAMAGLWPRDLGRGLLEPPLVLSTTGGGMAFGETFLRLSYQRGRVRGRLPLVARYQPQQQVLDLQEHLGFQGPSVVLANACASGSNAIGHAADWIRSREVDCVLVGGVEALSELIFVGFDSLQTLSPDLCRPFDRNRKGLILGEASAFVVLESQEHALSRGIRPLCYVSGYGHLTDLYHLTQPSPDGSALIGALDQAVKQAKLPPEAIGYVNAHGTGTPANDLMEAWAYYRFFGEAFHQLRVSSTKAAIGHSLGASGCVEAVFSILALVTRQLPPQILCEDPMEPMGPILVRKSETLRPGASVASVNLGFGGSNAALLFSPYEPQ